jgi:hypothetical protein
MKHSGKLKLFSDAINSKAPTLAVIKKENGLEFTQSFLVMWLVYLNKLLDLKKPNERRTTRLMCRNCFKRLLRS